MIRHYIVMLMIIFTTATAGTLLISFGQYNLAFSTGFVGGALFMRHYCRKVDP